MSAEKRHSAILPCAVGAALTLVAIAAPGASGRDYGLAIAVTQCRNLQSETQPVCWAAQPNQAATATLQLLRRLLARPRGERAQYATGQALELPTCKAIQKELQRLAREAAEGDRVVIYLATAAVRDTAGRACLLLDDTATEPGSTDGRRRAEAALPLSALAEHLGNIAGPQVLVFLDLCALDGPIGQAELQEAFGTFSERCAVLAWSGERKSYWEPGEKVTRLAGMLADGLRGAADADADGHLRHAELIAYLEEQSRRRDSAGRGPSLAVLNKQLAWEYPLQAAHFEAFGLRLAAAIAAMVEAKGLLREALVVEEPVGPGGSRWITPLAKILARQVAAALAKRGLNVLTEAKPDAVVVVSGRLEVRAQPDRLVAQLEVRSGEKLLGTVCDTMLATGDVADLVLPTARQVAASGRQPARLEGLRAASVEGIDQPPARHPHFTGYADLPVSLRFELTDTEGKNPVAIEAVERGGECYLPVVKGKCLRIWATRQSETPCALLVLVDGGNVMSRVGLPEEARFAAPEEHLARLHYFILEEKRPYTIEAWITLGAERKEGPVAARRLVVADGPDALGYRHPGAELGEVRILVYAARKDGPQRRAADVSGIGMGAGPDAKLPMSFVQWWADDSVPHARLVYQYRQAEDIPRALPR